MTDNNIKKPTAPKRPQCAFFIYKQQVYQQVKNENPGKKMTDITKLISEQYKHLSKEKIDEFEQKYKETKAAFEINKKDYEDKYGKIRNEKRKKRKVIQNGDQKQKKQSQRQDVKVQKEVKQISSSEGNADSMLQDIEEPVGDV